MQSRNLRLGRRNWWIIPFFWLGYYSSAIINWVKWELHGIGPRREARKYRYFVPRKRRSATEIYDGV